MPLLTSIQDIRFAFDSLPHFLIKEALLSQGVSGQVTGLHMQELAGLQGFMVLPNVGATPRFDFGRGGKQGGVETPDEWNAVVNYVLEPVVRRWGALGLGFKLLVCDGVISELINHAVWADNIILFAESYEHMQTMINDLDSAFVRTAWTVVRDTSIGNQTRWSTLHREL